MLTKQDVASVVKMAQDATDAATNAPDHRMVQEALGRIYGEASEILQDFINWKKKDDEGFIRDEPSVLARAISSVLSDLMAIRLIPNLSQETKQALRQLTHADPCVGPGNLLRAPYNTGGDIRKYFYGGFTQYTKTQLQLRLNAFMGPNYICPGIPNGTRPGTLVMPHNVAKTDVAIDHIKPVAQHWNAKGKNTSRADRHTWLNKLTNLQNMCSNCNTVKYSWCQGVCHNYQLTVGQNFTGLF